MNYHALLDFYIYLLGGFFFHAWLVEEADVKPFWRAILTMVYPITVSFALVVLFGSVAFDNKWVRFRYKKRLDCRFMGSCKMWGFEWRGRSYGIFKPTLDRNARRNTKFRGLASNRFMFGVMWD